MSGLSEQQLAEIAARVEAASAGPWMADGAEIYRAPYGYVVLDLWVGETLRIDDQGGSNADAEFIAHAPTDVRALLARVAELEAERHATNEALSDAAEAIREKNDRITELEKAACDCFAAELHSPGCSQSRFVVDGVEYSAVHWYRDADGSWWIPVGGEPMQMLCSAGEEPVLLTEVIADYGPLTRTELTCGDEPDGASAEAGGVL